MADMLILSLMMLADGWLLVRFARSIGLYLALALQGSTAILAAVVVGSSAFGQIRRIRTSAREGSFDPMEYAQLCSTIIGGLLILLPGFATDAIGLSLYLPPGRWLIRRAFLRRHLPELPEVYEYVKMREFSFFDEPRVGE